MEAVEGKSRTQIRGAALESCLVLLFCCAVPIADLLVVEMVSQAYSVTKSVKMFCGSPVMLLWWAALFSGIRRSVMWVRRALYRTRGMHPNDNRARA